MTVTETAGIWPPVPVVDRVAAIHAAELLMTALGVGGSEHTTRTAERMVSSVQELLTPRIFHATDFPGAEQHGGFVIARSIPFAALCAHHVLPFAGTATVGYRPAGRLLGLSKMARAVELFSCRLQVQEELTEQVAGWMDDVLPGHGGVGVLISAEHLCMSIRGVRARGASTVTSAWRGDLQENPALRAEFLSLAVLP